jgi:hypothetical protein
MEDLIKELGTKIDAFKETSVSKEDLATLKQEFETLKSQGADVTALKGQIDELALTLKDVQEKGNANQESFLEIVKANREKINASTKEKGTGKECEIVVKADTVRASIANNGAALQLGMNTLLATRKLVVYDLFQKIPVPKNANGVIRYVDWDSATIARAAAAIAEGGVFPEDTAKWVTNTLTIQKVGTSIPISEEFAYDDEMYVAEVANFIENDVNIKVDTDLITGNGTAPNIAGLNSQCTTYTAAASGIADASIYDLIVDMKRSITATGGSKFSPDFALMNVVDINKMLLKKDVNRQYVAPPFASSSNGTSEFTVAGVRIIECNAVTANTMIVGCSAFAKIYEEPGIVVATGYDGADWSSDLMTMKARRRMNLLVRVQDRVGFARVASISAALTTLAT